MPSELDLYNYQDYRAYLRAVVELRQEKQKDYTLRKFAKSLGFSSHAGLAMVLNGKRELRTPYLDSCIKNLKLNTKQRIYFEAMVRAGKLTPAKKRDLLRDVKLLSENTWNAPLEEDGFRLIDHAIIQQILCLYRGFVSAEKIHSHFRYELSLIEVKRILNWMELKKQIEASPEGYRRTKSIFVIEDEVSDNSGKKLHKECLQLAANAISKDPREKREFQSYVFTMNSKRLDEMKQKIKKIVLEAVNEFETELDGDTVTQIHFNMFEPIHRIGEKENAHH